jgi:hypothetical protein
LLQDIWIEDRILQASTAKTEDFSISQHWQPQPWVCPYFRISAGELFSGLQSWISLLYDSPFFMIPYPYREIIFPQFEHFHPSIFGMGIVPLDKGDTLADERKERIKKSLLRLSNKY